MREMKDSGVPWIGEIPKEWFIDKMNRICPVITDFVASGSFADLAENVVYLNEPDYAMLVRTADVSGKGNNLKPVYVSKQSYDFLHNSNLCGGELLLPNIGASVGDVYIVPRLYEHMTLGPNAIIVRTRFVDEYFYYFFYCDAGRRSVISISQSTAQPKFNKTDFRQIRACVPPLKEQQRIANFLDAKCAEIDSVLEQTKASIEEYKALKQSVITEAVTRGVRGERPMKDSGVEWIGKIPVEWSIRQANQIFVESKRLNVGLIEKNLLSLSYGKIVRKNIDSSFGLLPESFEGYNIIDKDMIVLRLTDLQNDQKSLRVGLSNERGIITSAYLSLKCKTKDVPKYLYYLLHYFDIVKGFYGMGGGIRQGLTWDGVKNLRFYIPNIDEQQEIAAYLDEKCSTIDSLIASKEALIGELDAYKKSLIYEYVTGKKEVL